MAFDCCTVSDGPLPGSDAGDGRKGLERERLRGVRAQEGVNFGHQARGPAGGGKPGKHPWIVAIGIQQVGEVRLHTAGALRNGCTPEQIGAVLKHVAVYTGVALAVAALNVADEEIAAMTA